MHDLGRPGARIITTISLAPLYRSFVLRIGEGLVTWINRFGGQLATEAG